MPWYIYSFLAVLTGSFAVLSQKWALNLKVDKNKFLVYVFLGLLVCYVFYSFNDLKTIIYSANLLQYLKWGILVAIFSMIGNLAGVYAYDQSPNPGYVQAIGSMNALIVLGFAAILFNSPVSWLKLIGIIIVIIGIIPLFYRKSLKKSKLWQLPAIISMLAYGLMVLVVKQMGNLGFSSREILSVLFFFGAIGFLIVYFLGRRSEPEVKAARIVIVPVFFYIILAFFGNLFTFIAINVAPNAGYAASVGNSSVIVVLFLSVLFSRKIKVENLIYLNGLEC